MLNTVLIALYTFAVGVSMYFKIYFLALLLIIFIPIIFQVRKTVRENKIKEAAEKIEQAKKDNMEHKEIQPFINVNKAPWYILELLPTVSRANAKLGAVRIKKKKVEDFTEFSNLFGVQPVMREFVQKIVKFN